MPLLLLDEDVLKVVVARACSVDIERSKHGNHCIVRVLMPRLLLRLTGRVFRQLAPAADVRLKIHRVLAWSRHIFVEYAVTCVLDAVKHGLPDAATQLHTLEKDGVFFHVQLHADPTGVLYQALEIIGRHEGATMRSGILNGLELPGEYAIHPAERTRAEQAALGEWCDAVRWRMVAKWRNVLRGLHGGLADEQITMFPDLVSEATTVKNTEHA